MKSTYRLLGLQWDGTSAFTGELPVADRIENVQDHGKGADLFDTVEYVRSIRVSELLGTESEKMLDRVVDSLRVCDRIVLIADCSPLTANPVLQRFYRKRLAQCVNVLKVRLADRGSKLYLHSAH